MQLEQKVENRSGRKAVMALIPTYLPGYLAGGPIRSLSNIVSTLGDEIQWLIVTTDRDLGSPHRYPGVSSSEWSSVGKAGVMYVDPHAKPASVILTTLARIPHDARYLNSFFSPKFSILPMVAARLGLVPRRPTLIAPRGEFSPGALRIKRVKKNAWIYAARLLGVYSGALWHASSEVEAADIRRVLKVPADRIFVARNFVEQGTRAVHQSTPKSTGLRVCFLGRISPMKNLEGAIETLRRVSVPVTFTIYGPVEDASYWSHCQALLSQLPANVTSEYRGPVHPTKVNETLAEHDVLLLPTRGENFGHVIHEAWCAGLHVLTSDRTPWKGLTTAGVGWDIPLEDTQAFSSALIELAQRSPEELMQGRARCAAFGQSHAVDTSVAEANQIMFRTLVEGRPPLRTLRTEGACAAPDGSA